MIVTKYINTVPGANSLSRPYLYGVNVLSVDRTGFGKTEISPLGTPTNVEFKHFGAALYFDPAIVFSFGEKIIVIYET